MIKNISIGLLVILSTIFIPYILGLFINDDEYSGPVSRWRWGVAFLVVIAGILFIAWVIGSLVTTLIPSKGVV